MDTLDILILIVLLVIFCKYGIPLLTQLQQPQQYNNIEGFGKNHNDDTELEEDYESVKNNNCDDPAKYINVIMKSKQNTKINQHFVENQYHTDYRDTFNAFDIITPNVKQLFNTCELPVTQTGNPSYTDTKYLVTKFIKEVNKTVKNKVSDNLTSTNWRDQMPQPEVKSGWDKQQEKLGLPTSIYVKPAKKAPIKLIKIDHAEKYETDKEMRFVLFLIIQKKNVKDQLVIKVSFVIDKTDTNLDRDFFAGDKNAFKTTVQIEEISIVGFLTPNEFGERTLKDDFYQFDAITDGKMFNQNEIITELNKKKAEYAKETRES